MDFILAKYIYIVDGRVTFSMYAVQYIYKAAFMIK